MQFLTNAIISRETVRLLSHYSQVSREIWGEQVCVWFKIVAQDRAMELDEFAQRILVPVTQALTNAAGGFVIGRVTHELPTPTFVGRHVETLVVEYDGREIRLIEWYNLATDEQVFSLDTMAPAGPKQLQLFL